jgi:hypothetical protein
MGTEVVIRFDFTGSDLSPAVWVKAKGQVNRVELSGVQGQTSGFAASTNRMTIEKYSDFTNELPQPHGSTDLIEYRTI